MGIATCVVVALSEDVRDVVAAKLKSLGMEATLVASPEELPAVLEKIPACGILLEVITAIKASPDAKKAIQELSEFYPLGKFKLAGNEVLILGKESLQSFVHDCQQFNPRTLRRDTRHSAYLAVHLCADEKCEDAEKVVTVNVSDHGCFVYSIREWSTGNRVWLRFLGDDADICGTVCAWQPWGNNKTMPGIGIKLDEALNNG
jgi:hypothetical protein